MKSRVKIKNIFKKGDWILLAVLIAAIIAAAVLASRQGSTTVEISVDGILIRTQDINRDAEFTVLDGRMTISVKDGKARVLHSDCAEQLCVHTAPITGDGGMIVCLPNKVIIKLAYKDVAAVTGAGLSAYAPLGESIDFRQEFMLKNIPLIHLNNRIFNQKTYINCGLFSEKNSVSSNVLSRRIPFTGEGGPL